MKIQNINHAGGGLADQLTYTAPVFSGLQIAITKDGTTELMQIKVSEELHRKITFPDLQQNIQRSQEESSAACIHLRLVHPFKFSAFRIKCSMLETD